MTRRKLQETAGKATRSPYRAEGLPETLHAGYQVARLARLIARNATRRLAEEIGLTLAEWRILLLMGSAPPIQLDALADKALLEKSHASIAVAALTRRKLVRRAASPGDGRRILLSRTQLGSRAVAKYLAATAVERRALWGVLSQAQRTAFGECMAQLLAAAEQESNEPAVSRRYRRRKRP
jgi:DNA-binding MarR family transcriptional regulator